MDNEERMAFYKQSILNPVTFSYLESKCPVAVVNGKLIKMVPLVEFIERLESGKKDKRLAFRTCNNEFED